jgi:hypothetical protein
MNTEQQFVDLIKEGKVADAMQLIKTTLTEMAGDSIIESKFDIAEACGMKKMPMEKDMMMKKKKPMKEDDDYDMEDHEHSKEDSMENKMLKAMMNSEEKKMVDKMQKAPTMKMKEEYGMMKSAMKKSMKVEGDMDDEEMMMDSKKMKEMKMKMDTMKEEYGMMVSKMKKSMKEKYDYDMDEEDEEEMMMASKKMKEMKKTNK